MIGRIFKLGRYFLKFIYYKSVLRSEKSYDVIYEGTSDLGGLYVKLIQFVCLRTGVFPTEQKVRFLSFYDNVGLEPLDVKSYLLRELGLEGVRQFRFVDNYPFATGSFAQVYKGQLLNGREVVIKIKRKNLRRKLRVDFFFLKIFGRLFDLFYYQRLVDVGALISEFEEMTYRELDYKQEVENALYFYDVYSRNASVCVPKTFAYLSTNNIIVQEYVGGVSLTDLIRLKSENSDYYRQFLTTNQVDMKAIIFNIAYEIMIQGFNLDKFYADPHPGNIKILPNNRFAIIDFGILGKSPRDRRNYYKILSLLNKRVDELDTVSVGKEFLVFGANYFYKCMQVFDYYLLDGKENISEFIIASYRKILDSNREKFKEIEIRQQENFTEMIIDIVKLGEKFNIMIPSDLFAVLRSVAIFKSYHEVLESNHHPMRDVWKTVLGNVNQSKLINRDEVRSINITLEEAMETILNTISRIAEIDMPLYVKLNGLIRRGVCV